MATSPSASPRTATADKRAIIDIGSNTVRLVVFNGPPRAPVVILNEKVNAKLGRDLGRTGKLPEKGRAAALSALARYAAILKAMGIEDVTCVATAAARDARNGPEFLDDVRALGLEPRLLTGEEEARASAMGVIAAFPGEHGIAADLGGGSLELVAFANGEVATGGITLPFGTLRLGDLRAAGARAFAQTVRKELQGRGWDAANEGRALFIVGGSWRALALQAMQDLDWPLDDPHGFELAPDLALTLCRRYAKGPVASPEPRITSARAATLPDAAALLSQLIQRLAPSRIVFSSWGLREGLLHAQLPAETRALDPMLAGVTDFVKRTGVDPAHADRVAAWTREACQPADGEEPVRLAATLLSLAAMRSEPNMRAEQAMGWALRKRWIGLDPRGRAMIAMCVFANSGETTPRDAFAALAGPADLGRAVSWGLATRLCRRLTGCAETALAGTRLTRETGKLVLTLSPELEALNGSAITKDGKALAEWLGVEWTVRVLAPA